MDRTQTTFTVPFTSSRPDARRVDSYATLTMPISATDPSPSRTSPCATVVDLDISTPRRTSAEGCEELDGTPKREDSDSQDIDNGQFASSATSTKREGGPEISGARKTLLLLVFCMAQFLDAFNNSALFPALPVIAKSFDMNDAEEQWIFSAYALTFSSFLLLSGRIADISSPKWTFIAGLTILSVVSLVVGFVPNKIAIIVLRSVLGIGAALTIPSSLSLLVWTFPEQKAQSRAIATFSGMTAIGNVLGLLIGAVFTGEVTWKWCFWFTTCLGVPTALVSAFFIPDDAREDAVAADVGEDGLVAEGGNRRQKKKKGGLDFVGVSLITITLILFVFGLTSGPTAGWRTAQVWAPLVLSFALIPGFVFWEAHIPEHDAALPPAMWFYPNFAVLFAVAILPFAWWVASFISFTELWQGPYGLTAVETAIRFLPLGVSTGLIITLLAILPEAKHPKRHILGGFVLLITGSLLLPFARGLENYWRFLFPAWVIGSVGNSIVLVNCSVAIFRTTPKDRSGITGAALNSALQLGCVLSVAAVTGITASVNQREPDDPYNGISASFWWLLGCVVVEATIVTVLYRERDETRVEEQVSAVTTLARPAEEKV